MMTNCSTIVPSRENISKTVILSFIAVNCTVGCLNIVLNAFLIYSFWKLKQLSNVSYKFLFCLSISDFCVGFFLTPVVTAVMLTDDGSKFCILEIVCQCVILITSQFSGIMVMIITADRYIHMRYLQKYNLYMTSKMAYLLIGGNFFISICLIISSIFASLYDRFFEFQTGLIALDTTVSAMIFILYFSTYRSVKSRVQDLQANFKDISGKPASKGNAIKSRRGPHNFTLAKTMTFILISVLICYFPFFVIGFIHSYVKYIKRKAPGELLETMLLWSSIFTYMNSYLNVIIFVSRHKTFKKFLLRKLRQADN